MLYRNFMLYAADDNATGNATETPPPDTQQANKSGNNAGQTVEEKQFTQADLNRVAAKEAKDAKAKTLEAVLKDLGIEDLSQAKAIIEAQKQKAESEKTEAQKLADQLQAAQANLEKIQKEKEALERQRLLDKRDSAVLGLLSDARNPSDVLALLKLRNNDLAALLDDNGNFVQSEAESLVEAFRKENTFYFKDTKSQGSPSNAGGRVPMPENKVQEEVRKEMQRKVKL